MSSTDSPIVSVIIPVYNDPEGVVTTLSALAVQTCPESAYEVLVVDNGSSDETRDVVREFLDRHLPVGELLIEDEIQGSYAARNKGIERANGSLIAFIDADMKVEKTWLNSIIKKMQATDCDYMGCDVVIFEEKEDPSLVSKYNQLTGFPVEGYLKNQQFVPTCCLVVRRHVFDTVGKFDQRMISGGDFEFGRRVHEAEFSSCFDPNIKMFHPARASISSLSSKNFRVGRGLVQFSRYHSERFNTPVWRRPGDFLPPHPVKFRQRIRKSDRSIGTITLVSLYIVAYLSTLARTAGAWYELLFH